MKRHKSGRKIQKVHEVCAENLIYTFIYIIIFTLYLILLELRPSHRWTVMNMKEFLRIHLTEVSFCEHGDNPSGSINSGNLALN